MLVVDLCNKETIENLKPLYERVRNLSGFPDDNFPCVLVGNKKDICNDKEKREISYQDMCNWAKECRAASDQKMGVLEISAKSNSFISEAFETLVREFVGRLNDGLFVFDYLSF